MASIGIYGVMNYLVIQRTREFGIRLSVGATRADVLRLVLGRAAVLIGAGTCFGAGGFRLARAIDREAALWNGSAGSTHVRGSAACSQQWRWLASYIPARRATRVDPMVALRYE